MSTADTLEGKAAALAQARPADENVLPRTAAGVAEIAASPVPVILRGWIADWPAVGAGRRSPQELVSYLAGYDGALTVPVSVGPPQLQGRMFYNDSFTGLNVDQGTARFATLLQQMLDHGGAEHPPLIYMASMDLDACLPGFAAANPIDFGSLNPLASVWIGTRTRVAAHNDLPLNIGCVVAGQRRFTLFPPDQTANLYPGPFELTPAGRPVSLVDFAAPDLARFPRFAAAMRHALVADLEPGDAIFIPSMWWHHVEANGAANMLVNYWWRTVPKFLGTPQDALSHAMLTLRGLPAAERRIWRDLFEHYVFAASPGDHDHIPAHARGILDPITEDMAQRVRGYLSARLKPRDPEN